MKRTKSSIIGILLIVIPVFMYRGCINSNQLENYSLGDWERRNERFEFTVWDQVKSGFTKEVDVPIGMQLCKGTCFNRGGNRYDAILEKDGFGISIHYTEYEPDGGLYGYPKDRDYRVAWFENFFWFLFITCCLLLFLFLGIVFLNNEQERLAEYFDQEKN